LMLRNGIGDVGRIHSKKKKKKERPVSYVPHAILRNLTCE